MAGSSIGCGWLAIPGPLPFFWCGKANALHRRAMCTLWPAEDGWSVDYEVLTEAALHDRIDQLNQCLSALGLPPVAVNVPDGVEWNRFDGVANQNLNSAVPEPGAPDFRKAADTPQVTELREASWSAAASASATPLWLGCGGSSAVLGIAERRQSAVVAREAGFALLFARNSLRSTGWRRGREGGGRT